MMKKRQIYAIHCAVILMVLISCSTAKSQWYAGASARMLTDAKSFGGSFEIGKEYSFGWLFIQGAYINRLLNYDQTFFGFIGSSQVPFGYGIGPGDVSFPKSTVVGGVTYAQGTYEAKTYSAYIPRGATIRNFYILLLHIVPFDYARTNYWLCSPESIPGCCYQ